MIGNNHMNDPEESCTYVDRQGRECSHRRGPDSEYCIFHDRGHKDPHQFTSELLHLMRSQEEWFFDGFLFPQEMDANIFRRLELPKISFVDAIFLSPMSFSESVFNRECVFANAKFMRDAIFVGTLFKGHASFGLAEFFEKAVFLDSRFEDNTIFIGSNFHDDADFRDVNFSTNHNSTDRQFEASFSRSKFERNADFRGATFHGKADLSRVIFSKHALFEPREGVTQNKVFFDEIDYRYVSHDAPESVIFRNTDLSLAQFLHTDVARIEIENASWAKLGRLGTWRKGVMDETIALENNENLGDVEILYRRLKINYEKRADYETAGDFHIGEMEMKCASRSWKNADRWALQLYKTISIYGESWTTPLVLLFVWLLAFSLLDIWFGVEIASKQINFNIEGYGATIVHGIQVATLQRPSDVVPLSLSGRALIVISTILSPVLIAFFLLALRRRFKR